MSRRIRIQAPCRVDLAGGTLDIWPLGLLHSGACTLNVAIDRHVRVALETRRTGFVVRQAGETVSVAHGAALLARPSVRLAGLVIEHFRLPPVTVTVESDSPRGAGLGASSALTVALIAAAERLLDREASPPPAVARLARDLEAVLMGLPTGIQDHYPALLGGVLEILHRPGGEEVRRLGTDLERLGECLSVVYSGVSHFSAGNNFRVVSGRLEGDEELVRRLDVIARVAGEMAEPLRRGDAEAVGRLMTREWEARRGLAECLSTPEIEDILERALAAGAWGGKVCGAGGGGCVALLSPPPARPNVEQTIHQAGYRVLDCRPTAAGLAVVPGDSP